MIQKPLTNDYAIGMLDYIGRHNIEYIIIAYNNEEAILYSSGKTFSKVR